MNLKNPDTISNNHLSLIWRLVSVLSMLMLAISRVERGTALFSTWNMCHVVSTCNMCQPRGGHLQHVPATWWAPATCASHVVSTCNMCQPRGEHLQHVPPTWWAPATCASHVVGPYRMCTGRAPATCARWCSVLRGACTLKWFKIRVLFLRNRSLWVPKNLWFQKCALKEKYT